MTIARARARFDEIDENFPDSLPSIGIKEPRNFRQYIFDYNQHVVNEGGYPWFRACLPGEMCDDDVLYAGLSDLQSPHIVGIARIFWCVICICNC